MTKKMDRSAAGLREALFDAIDKVRAGEMEVSDAQTLVKLSHAVIETVRVQLEFERMRLGSEIPAHLTNMALVPPLDDK